MKSKTRRSSTATCTSCGAKVPFSDRDEYAICPYCGSQHVVSSLLGESDDVSLERLRTKSQAVIEAERLKMEAQQMAHAMQMEREAVELVKQKHFRKGKLRFLLFPAMFIVAISFTQELSERKYGSALIALLMLVLLLVSYLLSAGVIKTRRRGLSGVAGLLALLLFVPLVDISSKSPSLAGAYQIEWSSITLHQHLPQPTSTLGKLHTNTSARLWLQVYKTPRAQYEAYTQSARQRGFTLAEQDDSYGFTAYDTEGYLLKVDYSSHNESMSVHLEAPEKMEDMAWPSSPLARLVPVPKSTVGKVVTDESDSLRLRVAQTSPADFSAYVDACMQRGFNLKHSRTQQRFVAENVDGYEVWLEHAGNNVMTIRVSAPER